MKGKYHCMIIYLDHLDSLLKFNFSWQHFFILVDFRGYTDVTTTFGQYFVWVTQILR